ncbi:MAG: diguanylate cyclase [Gammaproteobacteria bacterium]|nr:diguanylate cyclase [Gammaproteobacteria bacterium]
MKLLIAEDDRTYRVMLDAVTRRWGYEPVVVNDGEAAWEALQENDPPRLLLLDWMMPRLDGLDLCRRIRAIETSDPPFIILLTARNETEDIVTALEAKANDHISKPFDKGELQARLQVGARMLDMQGELNRTKEALFVQATHDALTGVLNRGAVMKELEREMIRAQRQRQSLLVGLCDVDHFKAINDTFGHLAGDAVLRDIAPRIAEALRPYDHVGRYGGEEFLVIVTASDDLALGAFERIRLVIADKPFVFEDENLEVTISCGATV